MFFREEPEIYPEQEEILLPKAEEKLLGKKIKGYSKVEEEGDLRLGWIDAEKVLPDEEEVAGAFYLVLRKGIVIFLTFQEHEAYMRFLEERSKNNKRRARK